MANPKIFIRRSATPNKVPTSDQLALGELAINTNDGKLFLEKDPNGVGIGTTVVCVNPFNVGVGSLSYDINFTAGDVGIGTDDVSTAVGSNNTAVLAAGIVTAYQFYGDGSNITGIATATTLYTHSGTFNAGNDTETDVAIVIQEEGAIYTKDGGYLRTLIEKKSDTINIGQQNTALINGIELKPGNSSTNGVKLHFGGTSDNVKLQTTSTGIDVTGHTETDTLNVSGVTTFQGNVDLGDDDNLRLGDSQDLQIYHSSSDNHSYIKESGAGNLKVLTSMFVVKDAADNKISMLANPSASVELYENNYKKFETKSDGVNVTGEVQCDSLDVDGSADITGTVTLHGDLDANGSLDVDGHTELDDVNISGVATISSLGVVNSVCVVGTGKSITTSEAMTLDVANKRIGIGTANPEVKLHMVGNAAQESQIRMEQYNDSADAPDVRIYRGRGTQGSPSDVQTGDYLFRLNVHGRDSGSDPIYHSLQMDVDSSDQDAGIVNLRTRDKDGNEANRIGIDKDGAIVFNDAYTFPTADGSANQVLSSDGSGNLSFSDIVGAAATVVMTSDPPSSPNSGDLWWDVDLGELFVYYSDGDSAQWVEANGGSILDITGKFVSNDTGIHTTRDVGIGTTTAGGAVHPNNDAVLNVGIVTANNIFGSEVEITSGDLTIPDSIVHRSDTNTKIRFPAADTITAETGGSERLRITSGGSVGFNTTLTQSSKTVHIAGDYRSVTQNVADEGLIFQSFTTASTGDVYPGISWTGNPTALGRARASINAIATNDNNGSDIVFLTRNAADGTELEVADDEKVRITSAGNVGVGTNNAEFLLDIQKDTDVSLRLKCNGTNSTDDTIIRNLIAGTSASNYIFFGDNADTNVGMIRYNHNDDSMRFTVGASERLRIHSDGHGEFYDGAVTRVLIADDVSMNSETTKSFPESGSGITFPSWATKITVVFYEISMSGTANILVRLNSNGSAINSNYSSGSANDTGSTNNTSTTGFVVINTNSSHVTSGRMVIERVGTDTKWVSSHTMVQNGTTPRHGAGRLSSYSGTIDGITVLDTGSNSFDGGTITVYAEA